MNDSQAVKLLEKLDGLTTALDRLSTNVQAGLTKIQDELHQISTSAKQEQFRKGVK